MTNIASKARRVWRSAQLYIGFHRDPAGKQRKTAKVWPPKNANATIHPAPSEQEAFLVVKSADQETPRDVQIKLHPGQIVLRRDSGSGWDGIVAHEHSVAVQVNGSWITINWDGSIAHEKDGDTTYVEADGTVLKKTEFVEAMMSGDGVELSSRTDTTISAIGKNGVVAKTR